MSHPMSDADARLFLAAFPFLFGGMWLAVTTLLGVMSGWFALQARYPRGDEPALLTLRGKSGGMGRGVAINGALTLSACRGGLRVGIWRIFGLFQRPFLVPWSEIRAEPKHVFFVPSMKLRFGLPAVGTLTIDAVPWQRLAAFAPEGDATALRVEPVSRRRSGIGLLLQWAVATAAIGTFFRLASHGIAGAPEIAIPVAACYGFPAVAFGVPQVIRWLRFGR